MPLPLTVSCFSKIQIGFTFLVPAHPGSPGKRAVKRVCVCVCVTECQYRIKSNTGKSDNSFRGVFRASLKRCQHVAESPVNLTTNSISSRAEPSCRRRARHGVTHANRRIGATGICAATLDYCNAIRVADIVRLIRSINDHAVA